MVINNFRHIRVFARPAGFGGLFRRGDCRSIQIVTGNQRQGARHPFAGHIFEIHITIHTRSKPFRPQLFKPCIKQFTGLTKLVITGIAQRQNTITHTFKPWRGAGRKRIPKQLGIIRHFALAVSRNHDDHLFHRRQLFHFNRVQLAYHRGKTDRFGHFRRFFGHRFGVAGLGAVKNIQRRGGVVILTAIAGLNPGQITR